MGVNKRWRWRWRWFLEMEVQWPVKQTKISENGTSKSQ